MSDLQCPATFHVLGPGREPQRWDLVHGAPIVAVHAAAGRDVPPGIADVGTLEAGRSLDLVLIELSDHYRGMHVLVLADAVTPPLRGQDEELVVRIDADGTSVERLPVD